MIVYKKGFSFCVICGQELTSRKTFDMCTYCTEDDSSDNYDPYTGCPLDEVDEREYDS